MGARDEAEAEEAVTGSQDRRLQAERGNIQVRNKFIPPVLFSTPGGILPLSQAHF